MMMMMMMINKLRVRTHGTTATQTRTGTLRYLRDWIRSRRFDLYVELWSHRLQKSQPHKHKRLAALCTASRGKNSFSYIISGKSVKNRKIQKTVFYHLLSLHKKLLKVTECGEKGLDKFMTFSPGHIPPDIPPPGHSPSLFTRHGTSR